MSYNNQFIITTLSSSLESDRKYSTPFTVSSSAPIIPFGRIRQPTPDAPYTVIRENPGSSVFPFGKVS